LLPVLCPLSSKHAQDDVKLGRVTDWQEIEGLETPSGQKLLLLDGEEIVPFLEMRELQFASGEGTEPGDSFSSAA
jgi:protein involved in temperature-dependent protein secretion